MADIFAEPLLPVELGPGKVLAGLVRKIDKSITVQGVSDPDGVALAGAFLKIRN